MQKAIKDHLLVLIHSPLVGPFTWSLVARQLQASGLDALVPALKDSGGTPPPYWQQHAACVSQALEPIPAERPLVLVGHSGAGPLLPAIGQASEHPVAGYIFVDAGLPHPGKTRLEELPEELRQFLASGERFPNWTDEDLREILPDEWDRQQMLTEIRHVPSTTLRKFYPMSLIGPMLLGISCLRNGIAPIWSKPRRPGGQAE